MTFTAGQVLTAAQLNDLSITSLQTADGTAAAPAIHNTGDTDTGIYWPAANSIAIAAAGTERLEIQATSNLQYTGTTGVTAGVFITHADAAGDGQLVFGDQTDTQQAGLFWDESEQILSIRSYDFNTAMQFNADDQAIVNVGSESLPGLTFDTDNDTGFYRTTTANVMGMTCGGTDAMIVTATDVRFNDGTESLPGINNIGNTDTGMWWPAADTLAFSTGGTEQLRITSLGAVELANEIAAPNGSSLDPPFTFLNDGGTGMFLNAVSDLRLCVNGGSKLALNTTRVGPGAGTIELGSSTTRWIKGWFTDIDSTNAVNVSSDATLKTRTGDSLGLSFLMRLDPFEGHWTDPTIDQGATHQWVSAQNVYTGLQSEGRVPEEYGLWGQREDGTQTQATAELIPVLVAAVQEIAEYVGIPL